MAQNEDFHLRVFRVYPGSACLSHTTPTTTTITTNHLRPDDNKKTPDTQTKPQRGREKVLEALIDGDGEWDALVVERDTPVMDGFKITSALRDFEKARRNRASTARAAAVEEHARAAGGAATSGLGTEQRDAGGKTRKRTARTYSPSRGWGFDSCQPRACRSGLSRSCGRGVAASADVYD